MREKLKTRLQHAACCLLQLFVKKNEEVIDWHCIPFGETKDLGEWRHFFEAKSVNVKSNKAIANSELVLQLLRAVTVKELGQIARDRNLREILLRGAVHRGLACY